MGVKPNLNQVREVVAIDDRGYCTLVCRHTVLCDNKISPKRLADYVRFYTNLLIWGRQPRKRCPKCGPLKKS